MDETVESLRTCALFDGIGDRERGAMLGCLGARTADHPRGSVILEEGEPARELGIVLTGGAQIVRMDYFGNRSIVAEVGPGELFAESFACADTELLPVSVVASEDSRVMLIDARRVTESCSSACEFHSRMIFNLLRVVARKNLIMNQKLEITSRRTTREKLMAYLMTQAKMAGSDRFTIPFDRQELADYLEVDRSGLSAEIGKLRREGVLESRQSEFTLL